MSDISDLVMEKFEDVLALLKNAGATIFDDVQLPSVEEWNAWPSDQRRQCLQAEFEVDIGHWCRQLTEKANQILTLSDIMQSTKSIPEEEYPTRDIARWIWTKEGPAIDSLEYKAALAKMYRLSGGEGIIGALDKHKLDLLASPTESGPLPTFTSRIGLPAITFPMGFFPEGTPIKNSSRGSLIEIAPKVPFGITFTGREYIEELLIRVAYAYEQLAEVQGKVTPFKLPSTELEDVMDASSAPGHNL